MRVHGSQELERFEGAGDRVERVVTKSGLEIECDFVVIGAGVTPDITLAQRAGLETDSGRARGPLPRDQRARACSRPGDIAEYDSVVHDRRLRIEHWDVAFNQGKYAALNMLGQQQEYDVVPYFWSDLARLGEHGVRRARRATGTRSGCAAASPTASSPPST